VEPPAPWWPGEGPGLRDLLRARRRSVLEMYAERLVEAAGLCHSSYCVAVKLSTLASDLAEVAEYAGWDAGEALREVLMSERVLEAACSWPLAGLVEEAGRPQFRRLRPHLVLIAEWLGAVAQRCRPQRRSSASPAGRRPQPVPAAARPPAAAAQQAAPASMRRRHPSGYGRGAAAAATGRRSRGSRDWGVVLVLLAAGAVSALLMLIALLYA